MHDNYCFSLCCSLVSIGRLKLLAGCIPRTYENPEGRNENANANELGPRPSWPSTDHQPFIPGWIKQLEMAKHVLFPNKLASHPKSDVDDDRRERICRDQVNHLRDSVRPVQSASH
jgi:hypothetical protein